MLRCFVILCWVALLTACSPYFKNDTKDNSPTSGQLIVYCDPGLYELTYYLAYTFMAQYPAAQVTVIPQSNPIAVQNLLKDSCELIILNRSLSDQEQLQFKSKNEVPKQTHLAENALALVCSKKIQDSNLTSAELKALLAGNTTKGFKMLQLPQNLSEFSQLIGFLYNTQAPKTLIGKFLPNTKSVLEAVAKDSTLLGLIDFAQCSDRDDTLYRSLKTKIKIMACNGILPSASTLKTQNYPLSLKVYSVRTTGDFTLAKGFEAFIAGPKGQWMFLKRGLLPARQQERSIQVNLQAI